jgi:hypothetical protein
MRAKCHVDWSYGIRMGQRVHLIILPARTHRVGWQGHMRTHKTGGWGLAPALPPRQQLNDSTFIYFATYV